MHMRVGDLVDVLYLLKGPLHFALFDSGASLLGRAGSRPT